MEQEVPRKALRWLEVGDKALATANLALATKAAKQASACLPPVADDEPTALAVARARVALLESDLALQRWELAEAEELLNRGYTVLRDHPAYEPDLWRLTARLAERRGRWTSAAAAWLRMERKLSRTDAVRRIDCRIRRAEVAILSGNDEQARTLIDSIAADPLTNLDPLLQARADVLRATVLEIDRQIAPALKIYAEVFGRADELPRAFVGLLQLRMARSLVRASPQAGLRRVRAAYDLLVASLHPDAEGLALSQLAVMALILRRPEIAALAAYQAELWRGRNDGTTWPLLREALVQLGHADLVGQLSEERSPASDPRVAKLLREQARHLDVEIDERSRYLISRIMAALGDVQRSSSAIAHSTIPQGDKLMLLRQRASLAWDAQAHVGTMDPAPRLAALTPPDFVRQVRYTPDGLPWGSTVGTIAAAGLACFGAGFVSMSLLGLLAL